MSKIRAVSGAPRVLERPHVCPEDGYCPYVRCPNATPGTYLVRHDLSTGRLIQFKRVQYVEADAGERVYSVSFVWAPM